MAKMPGLGDLETRVNKVEKQAGILGDKVEFQRVVLNEMNENIIKLFNAVIQLGFKTEELERRIVALERERAII